MSSGRCLHPLSFETLVDYWTADPAPADEVGLEEHLLACAECSATLEAVSALAGGLRRIGAEARVRGGVGPTLLGRLERDRRVIRRYSASAGGHIHCTAGAEDDLVVLELAADLAGVEHVDLLYCAEDGTLLQRLQQLPVIRGHGVVWASPGDTIRSLPTGHSFVRLMAVDRDGERLVGEYALHHTAYRG